KASEEKFIGQRPTEVVWSSGGHVNRVDDLGAVTAKELEGEWIGLDSTWYLAALIPKTPGFKLATNREAAGEAKNGIVSVAMKAMQALQPQVNALRTKYKNDPKKLQEETLGLYRKHHVNPMGGCLPMIAQIPIFYALYLALSVSVELQNATFLCFGRVFGFDVWICDLASHDPTYVLPLLMGVTMFMQQKMTRTTGEPRQAKMMLVMPFVFTFMFLNLP